MAKKQDSQVNVIVKTKVKKSVAVSLKDASGAQYGTGRRKNAVARVWVKPGQGQVIVNHKPVQNYFARETLQKHLMQPFHVTKTFGQYDVFCTVKGGGFSGQIGAILHGLSRALGKIDTQFHSALRQSGFLTRDSRVVERKKYGRRKARKSTQFSKR